MEMAKWAKDCLGVEELDGMVQACAWSFYN
jgi:hypothetical protein